MNSPRILVIGSANTDMVVKLPVLPRPGETVLGGRFYQARGGKGANQAVAAARAGGRVEFLCRVGCDALGDQVVQGLRESGVDTGAVLRDADAPSGVALILVDDRGENLIAVAPGANARLSPADVESQRERFRGADAVLLQLEVPMETVVRALELAEEADVPAIWNPAPAPAAPVPDAALAKVAILTPNETELEALSGMPAGTLEEQRAACRRLLGRGVGRVFLTRGARGVLAAGGGLDETVPAFPVEAVDTVAAGDCFAGALAVALGEGRPPLEACRFAAAAAAISVTREGAQPSLPHRGEIEALLGGR